MQRIDRIDTDAATGKAADLLAQVRKQMGGVPNILATMAQAPAALGAYLGFAGALGGGVLPAALREQLALVVAGANSCDYCASVHTLLGGHHGLSKQELTANLSGKSENAATEAALHFAARIVATRGLIDDADLAAVRAAGYGDEEIVEIVGHTALNIFTNYFNHIAGTDIDFPHVRTTHIRAAE